MLKEVMSLFCRFKYMSTLLFKRASLNTSMPLSLSPMPLRSKNIRKRDYCSKLIEILMPLTPILFLFTPSIVPIFRETTD
jgi:hypothetical protein